jgi:RNA polymerase sigma-70 factor (ECF subfamily)
MRAIGHRKFAISLRYALISADFDCPGGTVTAMAGTAPAGSAALAVKEARLARGTAVEGGRAFVALYERHELRAYNIAYRITGSEPDAADATQEAFLRTMRRLPKLQDDEAAFGPSLFAATRSACHDLLAERQPGQPSGATPDAPQEEIRDANMRLPERQREALAMLGLGELSYEEIAASIEMTPDAIAKLISRARLNLSDDLHGTALAAVAAPSPECERALPLIATRDDGQLDASSDEDRWLDAHLAGCERCRLCVNAMQEADASYRAWALIAALPWLFEETMAKAATLADVEWVAETAASRPSHRRRATIAAALAALLLGGGVAAVLVAGDPSPAPDQPAADTHPVKGFTTSRQKKGHVSHGTGRTATAPQTVPASSSTSVTEAGEGAPSEPVSPPADHQGASGLQPQQSASAPKSEPTPTQPSQPTSVPASSTTTQPPAEEPAPEHISKEKGKGPPGGVPPGQR